MIKGLYVIDLTYSPLFFIDFFVLQCYTKNTTLNLNMFIMQGVAFLPFVKMRTSVFRIFLCDKH